MDKGRLLVMAVGLIAVGMAGIFITNWLGGYPVFSGWMSPGGGMMQKMMGRGMMDQDQMKEMMQEMMSGRLPPGISPKDLPEPDSPGARLLVRYCSQCHNLPGPAMHTAEEWPFVEARMTSRMEMMAGMKGMMGGMMRSGMMDIPAPTIQEQKRLLTYLQRHALRPASAETLGPPGTPGLALFRQTCSQCHAMPDPGLHTADEWPSVVERMRKNMEIMDKPVITDQERDKLISYLSQHAR
jgi:cytochrome c5